MVLATVLAILSVPASADADAHRDGDRHPCADVSAAPFVDRDRISSVHRDAVDCLWHLGIVRGSVTADGRRRFDPTAAVDRGQFAGMLHRLLDVTGRADRLPEPRRPRFDDVPAGHTFDREVHTLASAGVIEGVDGRSFAPGRLVRRDQTASLLRRAARWATGDELLATSGPLFHDIVGSVHRDAIEAAFEFGLVDGVAYPCGDGGGRYEPLRSLQRQQAASVLARAIGTLDAIEAGEVERRKPDPECPSPVWVPRIDAAVDYAEGRTGSISFAVIGTDGQLVGHRASTQVAAVSVIKVMFLVAYLDHPDVRDRPLTADDRDLLEPMIRRSANEPGTRIADMVGPEGMNALAERAGMRDFHFTRPWGNSRTSARDQARFMLAFDRYVPSRHRDYARQLLTQVVPEQRWGIGQVATDGWTKHFKGGWGPGTGSVDHQVVLLRHHDGTRVALSVMTTGSPSHEYGKATLEGLFRRLLADLPRT
ncbi:serine hydrolase [Nitriliruptor alkaliphilus]|uniref:serine hydrolase n=1 Tax=Nitriliruptor alkaliphilus TaxID=427918 RepID=UPI0012EE6879|nr:serine hydrolase [Nitriliruptor alkaliphilus]